MSGQKGRRSLLGLDDSAWQRISVWPLLVASFIFLACLSLEALGIREGTPARRITMFAVWLTFLADYLMSLYLAENRRKRFQASLPSLIALLLPVFQALLFINFIVASALAGRSASSALRGRVLAQAISGTALLGYLGALSVLVLERPAPDATIRTLPEALWWAAVTMTTVGYGDLSPVTAGGRLIAVVLMVCGVVALGAVTGVLASTIIEAAREAGRLSHGLPSDDSEALRAEILRLRARLDISPEHGTVAKEPAADNP